MLHIMVKEILAPVLAFLCFTLIIANTRFFDTPALSKKLMLTVYCLKAGVALLYGYFYRSGLLTGGDTFLYFIDGNVIYKTFWTNPLIYLKLALGSNDYKPVPAALLPYTDEMRFWFDQSNYFIVRINALIRLFSFGVYNVHAIVFAFLSFTGTYNLYLFFENKVNKKFLLRFILFGIPSFVFWTSGLHKDAVVLFSVGLVLYHLDMVVKSRYSLTNVLFILLGLVTLGYSRVYLLLFLTPLFISMILQGKFQLSASVIYKTIGSGVAGIIIIAVILDIFNPKFSFLEEFLIRRDHFLNSQGAMSFHVQGIPHDVSGVMKLLLQAVINPFIRPLPTDCNSLLSYAACLETWCLLFFLLYLLMTANIKSLFSNPYAFFCILFGLSTLFLVGLIVNNSGAIIRYRPIPMSFILIGLYLLRNKSKGFISNSN